MEPVRFADILFIFLTLTITFAILWLVNRVRNNDKQSPDTPVPDVTPRTAEDSGKEKDEGASV